MRMKLGEHVQSSEEWRKTFNILVDHHEGDDQLGNISIGGRIILKWKTGYEGVKWR
jgi:hypothetical protein